MVYIRRAEDSDFDLLVELYINEVEPNSYDAKKFANDLLNKMKTILAFIDQKICGTISWDVRGGLNDGVGEITALGVNKAHRRQGIARLLIDEVIKDANHVFGTNNGKLRVLYLFMEGSNEPARFFYNSLGFNEVASIPSFYPNDSASIFIRYFL